MKVIGLASRLIRDLKVSSLSELPARDRLELLDAINGSLQEMDSLAAPHSKQATATFSVPAPQTVTITVTNGSNEISGYDFSDDDLFRTIRVEGDSIDNQIAGANLLRHPFSGASGSVSATFYGDAFKLNDSISEVASDFMLLETRTRVSQDFRRITGGLDYGYNHITSKKRSGRPERWWMEANAANQNPPAPSLVRLNTLPDTSYRLQADVIMAPLRVVFSDFSGESRGIPMRDEHIEAYLLPMCRGKMSTSPLWKDDSIKGKVDSDASSALEKYAVLSPKTLSTPANRVGTPKGF